MKKSELSKDAQVQKRKAVLAAAGALWDQRMR